MKRLFPRAIPEALIALSLLGGACSPSHEVKPGAPVLNMLSIIDPAGNRVDVTKDTLPCPTAYAEGQSCDPTVSVCELDANVACQCVVTDMCAPTVGTLNCTYPPLSTVVAVFDRLLDTTPFEPATTASVATLVGVPATTATTAADYTSTGSTTGLVFPVFYGTLSGPHIALSGAPALPTDDTVTITLDMATVLAKDKKTPFTGVGLLADGKIAFKTSSFGANITVPMPSAPMDMSGGGMAMCPVLEMDAGASDAGADAGAAADAAVADASTGTQG